MTATGTADTSIEVTGPAAARPHFGGFESLRALAAVMVVVHHAATVAGPSRSGFVATPAAVMDGGVAVFFVLSGFLIYRPLVADHLAGRDAAGWLGFWWRRLLRIVPAYWAALSFFWLLGSFDLGAQWWRYYLFLQVYSADTVFGGIVQAWSLCTEIVFYLLVPVWAALVVRVTAMVGDSGRDEMARYRRRAVFQVAACASLWAVGPASRWGIERWAPGQRGLSFNWLPTNLDLFATGMILAVLSAWAVHDPVVRARLDRVAGAVWPWWLAGVALFAWYAYRIGGADLATGYSGWFWHRRQFVLGLFTLLLLVPAVFGDQARGRLRRIWSWPPLVWVGTVSYGLYLWHLDWMQRAVGSEDRPGWVTTPMGDSNLLWVLGVGLGVGLLSAAVSWYLVEEPLQRWKHLVGRGRRGRPGHALGGAEAAR
ncbi:trehalose corynomycolate mycolyl acetyltransferase TmaT [soil metagenome]